MRDILTGIFIFGVFSPLLAQFVFWAARSIVWTWRMSAFPPPPKDDREYEQWLRDLKQLHEEGRWKWIWNAGL